MQGFGVALGRTSTHLPLRFYPTRRPLVAQLLCQPLELAIRREAEALPPSRTTLVADAVDYDDIVMREGPFLARLLGEELCHGCFEDTCLVPTGTIVPVGINLGW